MLCDNVEGRDEEGDGRGLQEEGDLCTLVAGSC